MQDVLDQIWSYEVSLIPILVAFVATEWINVLRRWTKVLYTPMYVPFLLPELNQDLSLYYGEDIVGEGVTLDDAGAEQVRRRLRWVALLSMALSVIIVPLIAGLTVSFFLEQQAFFQYLVAITLYRIWRCSISYRNFGNHAMATKSNKGFLIFLYTAYVGAAAQLTYNAYSWAKPFISTGNWTEMLGKITNIVFVDGIVFAIVVAALSSFFANLLADPKIRRDQLSYLQRAYNPVQESPESIDGDGPQGSAGAGDTAG